MQADGPYPARKRVDYGTRKDTLSLLHAHAPLPPDVPPPAMVERVWQYWQVPSMYCVV